MSETKTKTTKEKKKLSTPAIVLLVGLMIIAIPCIVFGLMLLIPAMQTGTPRDGNRFTNDFTAEITKEQVSSLQSSLSSISNVENVDVILSEGQLKIYIDVTDTASEETVDSIIDNAYNKVNSALPVSKYFTRTDTQKNYDLNISVYTTLEESETRQYKLLHKNSSEDTFGVDDLAHPKDQNLVNDLYGITDTTDETADPNADTTTADTSEQ
ncbi:MAG: hypothetical protein Q4D13_06240 [Erysipelotrichaceae bacterium]|nr:hypothetical protein [Erysipelotrichaceae bacterium]